MSDPDLGLYDLLNNNMSKRKKDRETVRKTAIERKSDRDK